MLPDYPQFTTPPTNSPELNHTWKKRAIAVIELILILVMLQAILTLFQEHTSEEPIRYRILAHSDAPVDQAVKRDVQQLVEPMITRAIASAATDMELQNALVLLEDDILAAAQQVSPDRIVTLERKQALFPAKRSSLGIHPQDVYEAYVVTIGSGRGDNWWCSVFPKVCYAEDSEEEVTFFVWEWISSWFK